MRISRPACVSCVPSLAQRCGRVKNTSKGFSPARLSLLVAIDVPIWTYVIHSNFIRRSGDGLSCARASQPRRRATSDLSSAGTTQPAGARAPRCAPLLCASRSPMSEAALLAFSDIPGLASALPERSDTGMDAALGAFREVPTAPSRSGSTGGGRACWPSRAGRARRSWRELRVSRQCVRRPCPA